MTEPTSITPAEASGRHWDVVIVGAGMGGCAAALALSEAPLDILVLEKGKAAFHATKALSSDIEDPDKRLDIGRWPTRMTGEIDGRRSDFWAALGCGVGGSTLLYAAALDRLRPVDFAPQTLPDGREISWPFSYEDLEPYYQKAEALLEVTGTPDPLTPEMRYALGDPPKPSPRDAWFLDRFKAAGLHPYRLHAGQRNVPGCAACLGQVCIKDCKRHAANSFLAPALASGRVRVASGIELTRLTAAGRQVETVEVTDRDGAGHSIRARTVVLAAGAYATPVLLLNSTGPEWPNGLANTHDQVGRNLMFHADRRLALWAPRRLGAEGPRKSVALRDFYAPEPGLKFGEMQSTGAEARYGNILYALRQRFDQSRFARFRLLRHFLRLPALVADRVLGGAAIFALILEDYPYPENRVLPDPEAPSGLRFSYTIPQELRARSAELSRRVDRALTGIRRYWLSHEPELNTGHPCGTCRAGTDPETSVVDADGRAHGTDNLYVMCAAAMSTSGASNPSLTIAASALRAGERLRRELTDSA